MSTNTSALHKMRSQEPCLGTWLSSGSPVVAELASLCGLDWLLLDMEHGNLGEADILPHLRAIRGPAAVVRVPTHEPGLIGRVLDRGADAVMVPHVDSAAEAEALVRAMRYPPHGDRGLSRSVRAFGFGLRAPDTAPASQPPLLAQIESAKGVANVDAIAATAGVDILFVGPADLRLSLGCTPGAPSYDAALERVIAAARTNAKHAGILVRDRTETDALLQRGFTKIAVDSDMAILKAGFLSLAGIRGAA